MLKTLTIVAVLIAGGTSLALAQNGLVTGNGPPVGGGAKGGPYMRSAAPPAAPAHSYTARHHKRMYMSAPHHKHTH
jgi:hypothetical protein